MRFFLALGVLALLLPACNCSSSGAGSSGEPADGSVPPLDAVDAERPPGGVHAVIQVTPERARRGQTGPFLLDASRSTGKGVLRYRWILGAARLTAGTDTDAHVMVATDGAADTSVALVVVAEDGESRATAVLRVDDPPLAQAGAGQVIKVGEVAHLDGTKTRDRERAGLSYAWSVASRPPNSHPIIADDTLAVATFQTDRPGSYKVQLIASDDLGPSAPSLTDVTVLPLSLDPPEVSIAVMPGRPTVGAPVDIAVSAEAPNALDRLTLALAGSVVSLDGMGHASWTPDHLGTYELEATAVDVAGLAGVARASVSVHASAPDDGPPSVHLSGPPEGTVLATPVPVTGTAKDSDLTLYAIELAVQGEDVWTRVAAGSSSVTDAELGTLDPTVFSPGSYDLRLRAVDSYGNETVTSEKVIIDQTGNLGANRFSLTDVHIDLPGIPIDVVRTYDSFRRRRGEFGTDWTVSYAPSDSLEASGVAGEGWSYSGNCTLKNQIIEESAHFYAFNVMGKILPFRFAPQFKSCVDGGKILISHFEPIGNVYGATLEAWGAGGDLLMFGDGPELLSCDGDCSSFGDIYDPRQLTLVLGDGNRFVFDPDQGLISARNASGQGIDVSKDGVRHTSGVSVAFERDGQNRITAIRRSDGMQRGYEYNAVGDLVATTDWNGGRTLYFYDTDHLLTKMIDPNGINVLTNEYAKDGRLSAVVDASGAKVSYDYDLAGKKLTVTDRIGGKKVMFWNEHGQTTSETDAAGLTTSYEYDDAGNRTAVVDRLGNRTEYAYDGYGMVTSIRRPTGAVEERAYDGAGRMISRDDGRGSPETRTYDGEGRLVDSTDAGDQVTHYEYGAGGVVSSLSIVGGPSVSFEYDERGFLLGMTPAGQGKHELTTDELGQLTSDSYAHDGKTQTISFETDPSGRLTGLHGPDGTVSRATYDGNGRLVAMTSALGGQAELSFDGSGHLGAMSEGDALYQTSYDAEGHPTSVVRPVGGQVTTSYDVAGRPTGGVSAGGAVSVTEYGAHGERSRVVDAFGGETRYEYDPFGRLVSVDGPSGKTTYEYDEYGRTVAETDAFGVTTRRAFDGKDNVVAETVGDGFTIQSRYDPLGRLAQVTFPGDRTTTYEYDSAGSIVKVTDPVGGVTTAAYGDRGLEQLTDALGHSQHYERDALGNIVSQTLASGASATWSFDLLETTRTGFDGKKTVTSYDQGGRITKVSAGDEPKEFVYDGEGRVSTLRGSDGESLLLRDAEGKLVSELEPDGESAMFTYDAAGFLTEVRTRGGTVAYQRDMRGHTVSVLDAKAGEITLGYDAGGRLVSRGYPNGVREERSYDALGNLASVSVKSAGTVLFGEVYGYDAEKRISVITRDDGRRVSYDYDKWDRIVAETITPTGGVSATTTFAYDAAGNLVGSGDRSLTYDEDDRLVSDGVATMSYDAEGRMVEVAAGPYAAKMTYDGLGRLVATETSGSALGAHTIEASYDPADLITGRSADGAKRRFLWDRRRDAPHILEEYEGDVVVARNIVVDTGVVARDVGGKILFLHTDRLGSVRLVTDAAGRIVGRTAYSAYGEIIDGALDDTVAYGFVGERLDPLARTYFLRARTYAPHLGRFLTADREPLDLSDPRSFNRYAYVAGRPTMFTDPKGTFFGGLSELSLSSAIQTSLQALTWRSAIRAIDILGQVLALGKAVQVAAGTSWDGMFCFASCPQTAFGIPAQVSVSAGIGRVWGRETVHFLPVDGVPPAVPSQTYDFNGWIWGASGFGSTIVGLNSIWNTRTPADYLGPFATISGPTLSFLATKYGLGTLSRLLATSGSLGAGNSLFWSPGGGSYGFSSGGGFGVSLSEVPNLISFSETVYWYAQ